MKDPGKNPRKEITIAGQPFKVPQPFSEGDVCDEGMANTLNQTLSENLRNNFAGNVKAAVDALEDGETLDLDALQADLDEYFDGYDFGARTGGGRTGDPVRTLARKMVRAKLEKQLKKQGRNFREEYPTAAEYNPVLDAVIERNPQVMEKAREIIEEQNAELDLNI